MTRTQYCLSRVFFLFLVSVTVPDLLGQSQPPEIEAAITDRWGGDLAPIKIFGQDAVVGQVIQAPLSEGFGTTDIRWSDPLPTYSSCAGAFTEQDLSVISRRTFAHARPVLIFINLAGGTGNSPGSKG